MMQARPRYKIKVLALLVLLLALTMSCAGSKEKSSYLFDKDAPESEFEQINLWYVQEAKDQMHLSSVYGTMQKDKDLVLEYPNIEGFSDTGEKRVDGSSIKAMVDPRTKKVILSGDVKIKDYQEASTIHADSLKWIEPELKADGDVIYTSKSQELKTKTLLLYPYRDEMVLDNQVRGYIIEEDAKN